MSLNMSECVTPRTVAHQAPLSTEFSRQEYQSGLPFLTPGDLSNAGIEPTSYPSYTDGQILDHCAYFYCWSKFSLNA